MSKTSSSSSLSTTTTLMPTSVPQLPRSKCVSSGALSDVCLVAVFAVAVAAERSNSLPRAGGVSRRFRRTSVRSVSVSISRRRQRRIRSNRTRRHYRTPAFACPRRPANRPRRLRSFLSQHRNRLLQLLLVRGVKYFVLGKVRV